MRTTITLAPDVAAAVDARRGSGRGVSDIVNELVRHGLSSSAPRPAFRQQRRHLGVARIPLDNIAAALELAEGDEHR